MKNNVELETLEFNVDDYDDVVLPERPDFKKLSKHLLIEEIIGFVLLFIYLYFSYSIKIMFIVLFLYLLLLVLPSYLIFFNGSFEERLNSRRDDKAELEALIDAKRKDERFVILLKNYDLMASAKDLNVTTNYYRKAAIFESRKAAIACAKENNLNSNKVGAYSLKEKDVIETFEFESDNEMGIIK